MFSFFNKFMLRSLFIRSLFILVLPLSTGFAMKESDSSHNLLLQNIPTGSPTENNSKQDNINTKGAEDKEDNTEHLISTPGGEEGFGQGGERKYDFKVKNVKVCIEKEGKGESADEYNEDAREEKHFKKMRKYELPFHCVKATVGFFVGIDDYSKDVKLNCSESLIFFYRRATFLFFCPLFFNSLLNFIFEIDNKPSGGYFNFFSVGWRTLPFLKIITFDIHFNWFLFAVSAWFDFVYFPTGFKNKDLFSYNFHKRSFIPMFLFAFVFDAVSLCVNFKVDDYFYITVNLSYVLQEIVGRLFYPCFKNNMSGTESSVCGHCTICTERNLKTFLNEGNKGNVDILPCNSGLGKIPVINLGEKYEIVENIGNNKANLNNININTNTNNIYNEDINNFSFANQYFQYNSGYFGGENNMTSQFNNNNIINTREDSAKNNNLFPTSGAENIFINNDRENIDNNTNNGANINIINNNSKLIDVNFQKSNIEENNINNDLWPPSVEEDFAEFKQNFEASETNNARKEENIEGNNNPEDNK